MRLLARLVVGLALCGSVVAIALDAWVARARLPRQVQRGDLLPRPSGITLAGTRFESGSGAARGCTFVRFASELCDYCKQDLPIYLDLESRVTAAGCESILLAPEPSVFPIITSTMPRR
jgi:hypothetical protein